MSEGIIVRKCESLEEFHRCVELQREIWKEAELEVEPATIFVVAAHSGGQVLGAFDGGRMVGYTLALVGLRERVPYLHSHMTGVKSEYRDRGVGRMLKLFQRDEALGRGIRLIQWTFDPLELRNAHFNLNRLGAPGCWSERINPMLSQTADHLFWMARYTERAENTARMLDVNLQTSLLPQSESSAELLWRGILGICELQPQYEARFPALAPRDVLDFMRAILPTLRASTPASMPRARTRAPCAARSRPKYGRRSIRPGSS